jgi:hypothetical protein
MATLRIYEGHDAILTHEGEASVNLTPHASGMNVVVNTQGKLLVAELKLHDIRQLAIDAIHLIQKHEQLRDKLLI